MQDYKAVETNKCLWSGWRQGSVLADGRVLVISKWQKAMRRCRPKHFAALITPFAVHWTLVRDALWAWS